MGKYIDDWGIEVKKRMIDRQISITDFANTLGVARPYLNNVINGAIKSDGLQARINEYLAIPPDFRGSKTGS